MNVLNRIVSRSKLILVFLMVLYWLFFWCSFFVQSVPVSAATEFYESRPLYILLFRGVGFDGLRFVESFTMRSCLVLNLPCWLITMPLGLLDKGGIWFGTNLLGARLALVTLLSGVQWYLLACWLQKYVCGLVLSNSRRPEGAG